MPDQISADMNPWMNLNSSNPYQLDIKEDPEREYFLDNMYNILLFLSNFYYVSCPYTFCILNYLTL